MVVALDQGVAAGDDHLRRGRRRRAGRSRAFADLRQAAHHQAELRALGQLDLRDPAADHARGLAVAAGHDLQRLGHAAAQAVHRLHVALPDIGEQFAEHGLRGRQRDVDLRAVHQVGIAAPVDQRQHAARAQALGQQAGHDVVLVVAGEREEQVDALDALVFQQVLVGAVAVQHQHAARQLGGQLHAAGVVALQHLDLVGAAGLDQLPGEPQADPPATRDHDALHAALVRPVVAVQRRQHQGQVLACRQHEDLVARFDQRLAVADDEAVGLVVEPAVDADDAHVGPGHAFAQPGDAVAHQRCARHRAHRHQAGQPVGEFAHLQRLGVLDQLADVARERFLGADHAVDGEAVLAEQRAAFLVGAGAHARDARRDAEHLVGDLAADQVGLVLGGAGDQHVAIARTGLGQHVGLDAAAHHAAQFEAFFELAQPPRVGVDDRDVVALRHQCAGHALADPAGAEDDDFQVMGSPGRLYTLEGGAGERPPLRTSGIAVSGIRR